MDTDNHSAAGIGARIRLLRGVSVMLDLDLATLYGVKPGALLQAVRRNRKRFPRDFHFQLTNQELAILKSQTVISSSNALHVDTHDAVISDIVESIRHLVDPPAHGRARPIGFTADIEPTDA